MTATSDASARQRAGRKSLSSSGDSPQIRVRVPTWLRERAEKQAAQEGSTVSTITRRALERALQTERHEVRVQRELHRAVVAKLIDDRDAVCAVAQRNLDNSRQLVRGSQAQGWLDSWQALLTGPSGSLLEVLLSDSEGALDLQQVSPFAGVLTEAERLAALHRASAHAPS